MLKQAGTSLTQVRFSTLTILRTLWKNRILVGTIWLLGSAATVSIVHSLRPVYSADTLILVESQKIPESFVAATVQTALAARLDKLKQQVLSTERLWKLIQELNLYQEQRRTHTREEVLRMMRSDMTISLERGWSTEQPGAFRVEYEAPVASLAAEVTRRMGQFFIDENLRQREVEAKGTSAFLGDQLEASRRALQEQEARLRNFKLTHNGELPEQENSLLANLSEARVELLGIQEQLGRAQQNEAVVKSALAAAQQTEKLVERLIRAQQQAGRQTESSAQDPQQSALETELERAQARLLALRTRYEDRYPAVQEMAAEVARLSKQYEDEQAKTNSGRSVTTNSAEAVAAASGANDQRERIATLEAQAAETAKEVRDLEARRDQVLQDVAAIQNRLPKLPVREQQLAAITRDYETSKASYRSLLDKKLASDVAANMERVQKAEKFVMLDPVRTPEKPIRPRRLLLSGAGVLLSLAVAVGLAILLELKRDVVLGEWELPAGTRVLSRLPRIAVTGK